MESLLDSSSSQQNVSWKEKEKYRHLLPTYKAVKKKSYFWSLKKKRFGILIDTN